MLQTCGSLLHKRYFDEFYLLRGVSHESAGEHFGQAEKWREDLLECGRGRGSGVVLCW